MTICTLFFISIYTIWYPLSIIFYNIRSICFRLCKHQYECTYNTAVSLLRNHGIKSEVVALAHKYNTKLHLAFSFETCFFQPNRVQTNTFIKTWEMLSIKQNTIETRPCMKGGRTEKISLEFVTVRSMGCMEQKCTRRNIQQRFPSGFRYWPRDEQFLSYGWNTFLHNEALYDLSPSINFFFVFVKKETKAWTYKVPLQSARTNICRRLKSSSCLAATDFFVTMLWSYRIRH